VRELIQEEWAARGKILSKFDCDDVLEYYYLPLRNCIDFQWFFIDHVFFPEISIRDLPESMSAGERHVDSYFNDGVKVEGCYLYRYPKDELYEYGKYYLVKVSGSSINKSFLVMLSKDKEQEAILLR
jgi:hypothetical protein